MSCTPNNPCIPNGTVTPCAATLVLDCATGNLSILQDAVTNNTVNLACTIGELQTISTFNSLDLIGTILQATFTFEDGVTQSKNVDLSSLVPSANQINVSNSNSIDLHFASNTLSANLNIDPASTLPVSASSAGVNFGCCPETPITANTTNTIQLLSTGANGYTLAANLKFQSSASILLSSSSSGLSAAVVYSTNANNAATSGTDGGIYVQTAASQLASLATNGFVTTGSAGTLLVGSDSKLYRIDNPIAQTPLTAINTNTISSTTGGANGMTITSNVNFTTSNTVQLSSTSSGLRADVKVDTSAPGNVTLSSDSNGLVASINEIGIASVQNTAATVQNPMTAIFGTLNSGAGGFAAASLSQYGLRFPSFTTTQRFAIPSADLYDTMFVFDNTIRAFMWYDAVNTVWVQLS